MKLIAMAVAISVFAGCATQRGNDRHAQHARDQIEIVKVQRESRVQEAHADAQTNTALVEALAEVARANPDHAPAVTVALAVIGVRGADAGDDDAPTVTLQQQKNEALEWTKALAPTVGGLVTGLGVAAINADVTKNAQDANRDIQINDANSDVAIVQAVAGLGSVAANSVGIQAGGDIYQVSDNASVDQSSVTTTTSATDSYNSADTNQTYTASDSAFVNAGVADYSDYIIDYEGSDMTLGQLLATLQAAGATYSIDLDGDGTPDVEGEGEDDGETVTINCSEPQFSPAPPQCSGV